MQNLRSVIEHAQKTLRAVGHFNVADFIMVKAIFASAQALNVPVILGASEGERQFLGVRQIVDIIRSLRDEFDYPIFLNADHTHSLERAVEAAKAGFDSVVVDLSALPIEENVKQTQAAVEILKGINPSILIEGEIGDIGTGSQIHESAHDLSKAHTTAEEARKYVDATKVDIFAPAVGNMHGMSRSMVQGRDRKRLDIARIAEIKRATGTLMTLHGASGTDDEDLRKAIAEGINIIHINTEVRVAWRRGLEKGLSKDSQEIVPYKILPDVIDSVKEVATSRLKLFNNLI